MVDLSERLAGGFFDLPNDILYDVWQQAADKYADNRAIVCLHQSASRLSQISGCSATDGPYLRWTYRELNQASHAFAQRLHHAGLRAGDRLLAFVTTGIEWHVSFRACVELGCTFSSLNPTVIKQEREAKHVFSIIEPAAVLVQNSGIATRLAEVVPDRLKKCRLLLTIEDTDNVRMDSWQDFEAFAQQSEDQNGVPERFDASNIERKSDDPVLILTTSGTTSLPKGCSLTSRNLVAAAMSMGEGNDLTEKRSVCNHLPLNHVFANNYIHQYQLKGGFVVHPAPSFEAGASLRAIRDEGCTDVPGVSAVISSILAHQECTKEALKTIDFVTLGATKILDEDVQRCLDGYGAGKVANGFGMTETAATNFQRHYARGSTKPTFYLMPGNGLRVCDPETGKLVPIGETGELHVGGPSVIKKYLLAPEQQVDDPFYQDDFGNWMKTGDQAVMTEDDVRIVGRYKDLIIRGGENIAPTAIEATLAREFNLQAEVVGAPDDVAGEVPVALVTTQAEQPVSKIKETLVREYGPASALDAIIPIQELGLDDWPKTNTGKVQKNVLRDRLKEHMSSQKQANGANGGNENIEAAVIGLWTRLLGLGEGTLSPQSTITEWADSLTMARFPGALKSELSMSISLQEVAENAQIASQVRLLESRSTVESGYDDLWSDREGPPAREDLPFVNDDASEQNIKAACKDVLSPLGLSWDDVEDVSPLYDFQKHFLHRRRPQSNNHRHAWVCNADLSETRATLEAALTNNAMLRTMAIRIDSETYHVIVRPRSAWFSKCITELDSIDSSEELKRLKWNDRDLDFAAYPGPMFRVVLAPIKNEKKCGLVYMAQHSAFDGISLPFFTSDLNALLGGEAADNLPRRVPFKPWVESAYSMETSSLAKRSVQWHVQRLLQAGIAKHKDALFPQQRAPDWFKGDSTGWIDDNTGKSGPARKSLDDDADGVTGLAQKHSFPGISALKQKHGIDPSQTLKTALALLNHRHTTQPVALFAQYQAARDWPFLQAWQASRMPPAMEVNGPTVQTIIEAVKIDQSSSALDMLKTMQSEQQQLHKHAAAPFSAVLEALNTAETGAGDIAQDAWRRQIFNWLPGGSGHGFENMIKVQQVSRTDVGLLWNCKAMGGEDIQIMPSWDDAQLMRKEVEGLLKEYVGLIKVLVKAENWQKSIEEILKLSKAN